MRQTKGFTLIELLLVVLIIGFLVSIASLKIDLGSGLNLRNEARYVANTASLLVEESILRSVPMGIRLVKEEGDSYALEWLEFTDQHWVEITDSEIFQTHSFPEELTLELSLEGLEAMGFDDLEEAAEQLDETLVAQSVSTLVSNNNNLTVSVSEEKKDDKERLIPNVFFFPSGEITPFELRLLRTGEAEGGIKINGDMLGRIKVDDGSEAND